MPRRVSKIVGAASAPNSPGGGDHQPGSGAKPLSSARPTLTSTHTKPCPPTPFSEIHEGAARPCRMCITRRSVQPLATHRRGVVGPRRVRDDGRVRVLIPLPDRDFDVTEVAVPWRVLRDAGHQVVFATEQAGTVPAADPRLLTGVIFGQLGAAPEAKRFYAELAAGGGVHPHPAWERLDPAAFDGLLLPGGHAPGMRQYLGSAVLRDQVARFWGLGRPVGAICHGVLVLARTRDPATGRSVLADRQTTCLPKYMERLAYLDHCLAARPLLPDLSRLRRGRGQSGPGRPGQPVPARAHQCSPRAAPLPTTRQPSP